MSDQKQNSQEKMQNTLKRSQINQLLSAAQEFFQINGWDLPPNPKWDIFSPKNNVEQYGLVLVNLAEEKEYCEKLMYQKKGMICVCHMHKIKKEDIICRKGLLEIQLWNARPNECKPEEKFQMKISGVWTDVKNGQKIILKSGERVSIYQKIYHQFQALSDQCIIGEVSTANNDLDDNFFDDPTIIRFQNVIEDEPVQFKLISDKESVQVSQQKHQQMSIDDNSQGKHKKGIMCGGNIIMDYYKVIPEYPKRNTLVSIISETFGSGGCAYNVISALQKMDVNIPLYIAGAIGQDSTGEKIKKDLIKKKINIQNLLILENTYTSYTDVMTVKNVDSRTFFHMRGANDKWDGLYIDFSRLPIKIFHLGYLLLLAFADQKDDEFGTVACRLLWKAQQQGIKTSIDTVTLCDPSLFQKIVVPALKYANYCIVNEIEAQNISGVVLKDKDEQCIIGNMGKAADTFLQYGVKDAVIIHFSEGSFAKNSKGQEFIQGSMQIPKEEIMGTCGSGDAFCAGVLYSLHEDLDIQECLRNGTYMAAQCLFDPSATNGLIPLKACKENFKDKYHFRNLNKTK